MKRRHTLALLATTAALWAPLAQAQPTELNFGIISTESTQNLKQSWQPLLDDMSAKLGMKVNAFFAPDYAGVIEGMRFNKVHVAWFGNKSGMEAVDRASGEIFVQTTSHDGAPGYWSTLIVHKDSPLKTLDDVLKHRKDLTLGFGDPNSTSGTLVPGFYAFQNHNVDPIKDFKRTVRANHETNLLAVATKQVDVATNNNENFDRLKKTQPQRAEMVREVWRSPLIPADPIVWRKDLDPALKAKVRAFMLDYGQTETEKKVLATLGLGRFKASSNDQLLPIRQLELAKQRNKIDADANMAADEKQRKLKEIDEQLAKLKQLVAAK